MKNILIIMIAVAQNYWAMAQSKIEKDFEVADNQKIVLEFDEASIINVSEWDEKHIRIHATVSINDNTQNEAYKINSDSERGQVAIRGSIQNKESLPQVIRIKKGDEIFTFQTDDWEDPVIKDFYRQHGDEGIQWKSYGISWDVQISLLVPKKKEIIVNSKHGIIELENLSGKVHASSKHGGIDLTVNENTGSEIDVKTRWGTIYSNLNLDINDQLSTNRDWNHVVGVTSGRKDGSQFNLESRHANIYLRY